MNFPRSRYHLASLLALSAILFAPATHAQTVTAVAGGRNVNVTVLNTTETQNTTTQITETQYASNKGFGLSGNNVITQTDNAPLNQNTAFILPPPTISTTGQEVNLPFSLSVDSYEPGIKKVIVTNQDSQIVTTTYQVSVFDQ